MRGELIAQDGMVFKRSSVVIPKNLGKVLRMKIHSSHQGIGACQKRVCECIYWPGRYAEMKQYICVCEMCTELNGMTQASVGEKLAGTSLPWMAKITCIWLPYTITDFEQSSPIHHSLQRGSPWTSKIVSRWTE